MHNRLKLAWQDACRSKRKLDIILRLHSYGTPKPITSDGLKIHVSIWAATFPPVVMGDFTPSPTQIFKASAKIWRKGHIRPISICLNPQANVHDMLGRNPSSDKHSEQQHVAASTEISHDTNARLIFKDQTNALTTYHGKAWGNQHLANYPSDSEPPSNSGESP